MRVASRSSLSALPSLRPSKWVQLANSSGRGTQGRLPGAAGAGEHEAFGSHHPPAFFLGRRLPAESIAVEDQQVDQAIRVRQTRRPCQTAAEASGNTAR
jgi:hypothetical protein